MCIAVQKKSGNRLCIGIFLNINKRKNVMCANSIIPRKCDECLLVKGSISEGRLKEHPRNGFDRKFINTFL